MKLNTIQIVEIIKIIFIQVLLLLVCHLMYSISFQLLSGYAVVSSKLPENFIHLSTEEQKKIQEKLSKELVRDFSQSTKKVQKDYFNIVLKKPIFIFIGSLFWAFFYIYISYFVFSRFLKIQPCNLGDKFSRKYILIGFAFGLVTLLFMIVSTKTLTALGFKLEPNDFQKNLILSLKGNQYLFLWSLYSIGLITGITEEIFFRGFLLKHFKEKGFIFSGLVFSSLLFGLMHLDKNFLIPVLLSTVGFIFGYLYVWTKNIWTPISAHITYNTLILTIAYFSGDKFL